ncbi:MAG TPA: hypothetical protein VF587_19655 [Solirubrobacteraceae bacterium]
MTPLRAAFVGDAARFASWVAGGTASAAHAGAGGPGGVLFVDSREAAPGDVAASLRVLRPSVVVALGVADLEPEALDAGAPVLGVVVARERPPAWALKAAPPGEPPSDEILAAAAAEDRARLFAPGSPGDACDRLVALDPRDALGGRLWRIVAPPVDDALFAAPRPVEGRPRIVFAAPSSEHRERWLTTAKHLHDVRHVAHGVTPERLGPLLDETDVALVAHPTARATFDHRVAVHLAAGHLVISEPLRPSHGLEPNIDYLETADPEALARVLHAIRTGRDTHRRVRARGHLKAQRFRASHVWGRVLDDFLRDVRS